MTHELANAVRQCRRHLRVASWQPGLYHVVELGLPPRASCGVAVGPRLVDYLRRPQGPRARVPYLCRDCHLAFLKCISDGITCPRGHGPMVLDTEGEEYLCLFCSERRYPSIKGEWSAAAKIRYTRKRRKAVSECIAPYQLRLFEIIEQLEKEVA